MKRKTADQKIAEMKSLVKSGKVKKPEDWKKYPRLVSWARAFLKGAAAGK